MKSYQTTDADNNIRKHEADWHKNHPLSQLFDFLFHRCAFGSHHPQRRFRNARSGIRLNFVIYYIIDSGATRVAKAVK